MKGDRDMIATGIGVRPMPSYVPPADGKPRDMVDAKWMSLARAASKRSERRMRGKAGADALQNDQQ